MTSLRSSIFIFVAFAMVFFSAPAQSEPPRSPIWDYLDFIARMNLDPAYIELRNAEQELVQQYNNRDYTGLTQLNHSRLSRASAAFEERFKGDLRRLKDAFARRWPSQVSWQELGSDGLLWVDFRSDSSLSKAFRYGVTDMSFTYAPGHRAAYTPFIEIARSFIGKSAFDLYEDLLVRIERDPLYQDLAEEERKQIDVFTGSGRPGAEKNNFSRLGRTLNEFSRKYDEEFRRLRFAFSLRFPSHIESVDPRADGIPFVFFKRESALDRAFDYHVTSMSFNGPPGTRVSYHPFNELAREFLIQSGVTPPPLPPPRPERMCAILFQ